MSINNNKRRFLPEYDKIFQATQAMVEAGTIAQASLGEIAYRAGVSETTLRIFFRSKQEILHAIEGEAASR